MYVVSFSFLSLLKWMLAIKIISPNYDGKPYSNTIRIVPRSQKTTLWCLAWTENCSLILLSKLHHTLMAKQSLMAFVLKVPGSIPNYFRISSMDEKATFKQLLLTNLDSAVIGVKCKPNKSNKPTWAK